MQEKFFFVLAYCIGVHVLKFLLLFRSQTQAPQTSTFLPTTASSSPQGTSYSYQTQTTQPITSYQVMNNNPVSSASAQYFHVNGPNHVQSPMSAAGQSTGAPTDYFLSVNAPTVPQSQGCYQQVLQQQQQNTSTSSYYPMSSSSNVTYSSSAANYCPNAAAAAAAVAAVGSLSNFNFLFPSQSSSSRPSYNPPQYGGSPGQGQGPLPPLMPFEPPLGALAPATELQPQARLPPAGNEDPEELFNVARMKGKMKLLPTKHSQN
jgi:hypothetical protein